MCEERKRKFLQTNLLLRILSENEGLNDSEVVRCSLEVPTNLDGFMATIYSLSATIRNAKTQEMTELNLLVKVMKGDDKFRRESLGLILFPNEINVYKNIIPSFKQLITNQKANIDFKTWTPKVFFAEQGYFPQYSDQFETILAMQNCQVDGFRSGPRLDLDEEHLTLMIKKVAQFHACSYALRILDHEKLDQLVEDIIPLNFIQDGKIFFESYDIVFHATQKRMFDYFDLIRDDLCDSEVLADIDMLKKQYLNNPSQLMQRCLRRDDIYSVILHGDYNRNNVLFKYRDERPTDVLMIDFQENRFGSPALDLSFFMYMNMNEDARNTLWEKLLDCYHAELIKCILEITKLPSSDDRLEPYRFPKMMAHLSQFFIYGAIIAVKFLPVMMGDQPDVDEIVHYFHNDIHAQEFEQALMRSGGVDANRRIAGLMMHCSRKGYLKFLRD